MNKPLTGKEATDACRLSSDITINALKEAISQIKNGNAMTDVSRDIRRAYIKHYEKNIKKLKRG